MCSPRWASISGTERARNVSRIPEGVSFETAATFPVSYQTAFHALVDRARIQPGQALLVLGAAGATGYAAVQLAEHMGARVIASASSGRKQELARAAGADAVVTTGAPDWGEQVKAANDGKPIDVVFDPVGGEATQPAFRSLGYGGARLRPSSKLSRSRWVLTAYAPTCCPPDSS